MTPMASGLSRSELTSITGLNRSTIAALVGELAALGLVTESEPQPAKRVGRPSPVVSASGQAAAIAVNPEIDAITVGVVGLGGQVVARVRVPTDAGCRADEAVALTAAAVRELIEALDGDVRVVGIGVAVPGLVRASDGLIRLAPHFRWVDEPFSAMLADGDRPAGERRERRDPGRAGGGHLRGRPRHPRSRLPQRRGERHRRRDRLRRAIRSPVRPATPASSGTRSSTAPGVACHCGATGCLETEVRRERLLAVAGLDDSGADGLEAALRTGGPEAHGRGAPPARLPRGRPAERDQHLQPGPRRPRRIPRRPRLGRRRATSRASCARQPLAASREGVTVVPAELGRDILMIGAAELAFAGLLADPASFG